MCQEHRFYQRIYTQHTDVWGIVYYANYFALAEHARSEWFRSMGIPLATFTRKEDGYFVVVRAAAEFKAPAFLDDMVCIQTKIQECKRLSLELSQIFSHEERGILAKLSITIAWLNRHAKPSMLPQGLLEHL